MQGKCLLSPKADPRAMASPGACNEPSGRLQCCVETSKAMYMGNRNQCRGLPSVQQPSCQDDTQWSSLTMHFHGTSDLRWVVPKNALIRMPLYKLWYDLLATVTWNLRPCYVIKPGWRAKLSKWECPPNPKGDASVQIDAYCLRNHHLHRPLSSHYMYNRTG